VKTMDGICRCKSGDGRDAAETYRERNAIPRLQAQLVASPAGYTHQSVIMCSPAAAVLVVAGWMLSSGEAGEVAHHGATPRWTTHTRSSPIIFFPLALFA
jgi:hypothetical protein